MFPSILMHQQNSLYWRIEPLKLCYFAEKKRTCKKTFDFIAFDELKILAPKPEQMKSFGGDLRIKILWLLEYDFMLRYGKEK
jgi:hypothetical protein